MTEIQLPAQSGAVGRPSSVGQATAIEQARAIAEVQAAIVVAQQCPRDVSAAVQSMRESCDQLGLAERAFFRYNRGGSQITGESIHLARELARCWGNVQYGLVELSRDDVKGESQMLAFAWDVQTNTRPSTTFIVKHGRDTTNGRKALVDLRDIYENNANMGARRLREQIFAVLPKWFIEDAKERCRATVERGDSDKPMAQRVTEMERAFNQLGVTAAQLEAKVGAARADWTPHDLATLSVIGRSIKNGEATIAEEFEPRRVTAAEITQNTARGAQERAGAGRPPIRIRDLQAEPTDDDIAAMNDEANAQAAEREADQQNEGLFQ